MGISEREHHIKVLEQFIHDYQEWGEDLELEETIKYAISSLKTDLKYDLMYEGEEVYTKADMVAMLEELKEQLREMHEDFFETEHYDEAYGVFDSMDLIEQKIHKLKEIADGKNDG